MSIRVGINPLTWTNDDLPALGGETPLATCLAEARQAGYAGVELGYKFPREPRPLADVLGRHGLALASGWYGSRLLERTVEEEWATLAPHLELLASLGCTPLIFAETARAVHGDRSVPLSRRPRLDAAEWRTWIGRLSEVAERVAARGLCLAYHHHMGTVVETESEVDRLMADTGEAVGLLLDTGHLTYAGGDVLGLARRHAGRIVHVHLKDCRPPILAAARGTDGSFLDAVLAGVFTVPGDGCVDYPGLFRILRQAAYDGWLVVEAEQDPAQAHPLTYARMGYEYTVREAQRAGLLGQAAPEPVLARAAH